MRTHCTDQPNIGRFFEIQSGCGAHEPAYWDAGYEKG
jgi:hypothetical protein